MLIAVDKKLFWFWFLWIAGGIMLAALFYKTLFDSFWGSLAGIFLFALAITLPLAVFFESLFKKYRLFENKKPIYLLAAFSLFFLLVYTAFSWHKHENFATGYDLAIFDQAIWHMSRFEIPASSVRNVPVIFADHFDPAIALAAPIYWLFSDARMLLLLQVIILIAPVFVFYAWGRRSDVDPFHLLILSLGYLTAVCVQGVPNFDFHETSFAPLFLVSAFYFLSAKRRYLYYLSLLLLILLKEEFCLLVVAIGLFHVAEKKRRLGINTAAMGLALLVVIVGFIMPAINLSGSGYVYGQLFYGFENGFWNGITHYLFNPSEIAKVLSIYPDKWWNLIFYLGPLCLPFAYCPPVLILFLPAIGERVLSSYEYLSYPRYYYNLVFPALGLVVFVRFLVRAKEADFLAGFGNKLKRYNISLISCLVFFPLAVNLVYSANYSYLFHPIDNWNSVNEPEPELAYGLLEAIPGGASVAASQVILPHLSHRKNLYMLPRIGDARFVAIHFCRTEVCNYWPMKKEDIPLLRDYLSNNSAYAVKLENGSGMIFERTGDYDQALKQANREFCLKTIEGVKLELVHRNYLLKNCDF
ncbi:MAG TPA: DUF2079 domain-containing protein [Candidatus Paceibacterota bacterium]|nr:DUF2079 domain-containing protein [Candidatus Pacearchaeota archaeon]HRZ50830.1 DUF2079 domain-containing protein [Candidatus Paceibacterota bacterium]HSA36551.1 DUF2079 domain-containing protein [Candidatus Paceibacterota bacterium]